MSVNLRKPVNMVKSVRSEAVTMICPWNNTVTVLRYLAR